MAIPGKKSGIAIKNQYIPQHLPRIVCRLPRPDCVSDIRYGWYFNSSRKCSSSECMALAGGEGNLSLECFPAADETLQRQTAFDDLQRGMPAAIDDCSPGTSVAPEPLPFSIGDTHRTFHSGIVESAERQNS